MLFVSQDVILRQVVCCSVMPCSVILCQLVSSSGVLSYVLLTVRLCCGIRYHIILFCCDLLRYGMMISDFKMLYCILLYYVRSYHVKPYSTLHFAMRALCCTIPYRTDILYYIIPYAMLYCFVQYHIVLCCASSIAYYTRPNHIISFCVSANII